MNTSHNPKKVLHGGFTIIELIVSISIISVITAVFIFNQRNYADAILLQNSANDLELQIREAQVYGISVREFSSGGGEFTAGYGVSINVSAPTGGDGGLSAISFADRVTGTGNGSYDTPLVCAPGPTSECIEKVIISRGNYVSGICVIQSDNTCNTTVSRMDISFLRPNPNAKMVFFQGDTPTLYSGYIGARITMTSPKGLIRYLYIYTTGQIRNSDQSI
jgi:prepilin-type N-terminal cleavage/methylation domain-containing protein